MTSTTNNPASGDQVLAFAQRQPSQQWERIVGPNQPQQWVWGWFKPSHSPLGVVIRFPEEAIGPGAPALPWTIRQLAPWVGVDPTQVAMWQVYGMVFHGMGGTNPLLDQPIPVPPPGVPAEVLISVTAPMMGFASPPPMTNLMSMAIGQPSFSPTVGAAPVDGNAAELLDRLDIEWNSVVEIEKDLERLRKMLVDLSSRMKILNRDLSSDERLYSSREDKQDWQDCRRFLRDGENRLRACVKEYDIGDPSSAGYRRSLEMIYVQFVQPKIPFPGMEQALVNFEAHRKLVTTLQGKMNSVYLGAVQNGERRAQQVLARIAGKVREAGTKKTALGALLDGKS